MSRARRGPSDPNDKGPFVLENSCDGVGIPSRLHGRARHQTLRGHDRRRVPENGSNKGHLSHGHGD